MFNPIFRYCPLCATPLIEKYIERVQHATCPHGKFSLYLHPPLVAIAVVQQAKTLLFGKRAIEPGKDLWSFFGGYVEQGEKVEDAARREVQENTL
jgi:NADH pyrophosphatase NudC (nudix superfamily)